MLKKNNTMKIKSLELKFLIPYVIAVFIICLITFIGYVPIYINRFLETENEYVKALSQNLDNSIINVESRINIFSSYIAEDHNTDSMSAVFTNVLKNNKDLTDIYFANTVPFSKGGIFINALNPIDSDYDQTTRDWYINAINSSKIEISDPYEDYFLDSVFITFSKSIFDSANKLLGVLATDFSINHFLDKTIKDNPKYSISLIDEKGTYLFHSNKDYILKSSIDVNKSLSENKKNILNNDFYSFVSFKDNKGYISSKMKTTGWTLLTEFDITSLRKSLLSLVFVLFLVLLFLSAVELVLVIVIAKPISNTLGKTIGIIESMAEGNFNITFDPKYLKQKDQTGEVMRALDSMRERLGDIIYNMKNNINGINEAVNIITRGSNNLSERTNYQASALEELASSVEFVFSSLKDTAVNTNNAKKMSEDVSVATKNGVVAIENASDNMLKISDASRKISDITKIIESIALQTNILALNASVEAARAGDQGKGFAVVASEVRTLAINVGNAAKDISHIAAETIEKIEEGTASVEESASILRNIETAANDVANVLIGISNAIVEEEDSLAQINTTVNELNSITQENSKVAEDGAIASRDVLSKSENIVNEVSYFHFE